MGLDGVGPSGGESSKRKGEGSLVRGGPIHAAQEAGPRSDRVGHHPLARSRAEESGDTETEGAALALEREVRR
jgi:hypothetical protein